MCLKCEDLPLLLERGQGCRIDQAGKFSLRIADVAQVSSIGWQNTKLQFAFCVGPARCSRNVRGLETCAEPHTEVFRG
jgi:hypothetical protein